MRGARYKYETVRKDRSLVKNRNPRIPRGCGQLSALSCSWEKYENSSYNLYEATVANYISYPDMPKTWRRKLEGALSRIYTFAMLIHSLVFIVAILDAVTLECSRCFVTSCNYSLASVSEVQSFVSADYFFDRTVWRYFAKSKVVPLHISRPLFFKTVSPQIKCSVLLVHAAQI